MFFAVIHRFFGIFCGFFGNFLPLEFSEYYDWLTQKLRLTHGGCMVGLWWVYSQGMTGVWPMYY